MKKNLGLITTLIAALMLTGCLENGEGTEVVSSENNNSDFSVITEPVDDNQDQEVVVTPTPPPEDENSTMPVPTGPEGFDINKGDVLTASTSLNLDFYSPFSAAYTKITENSTCEGGSYGRYVDYSVYVSTLKNQRVPLSVQFRDYDGRVSKCYTRAIYIDQIGPDIVFAQYPSAPVEEGNDVEIVFTVTDVGAGVRDVTCQFAGITKNCAAGQNKIIIPKMASGNYTLSVAATDKLGHASQKAVSFSVTSTYKNMLQAVKVNEYNKVDILFVVDNSGSMAYEQKSMASRVRNFLDVVKGLDWQIAVTTTDPSNKTYGDGRLVSLYGNTGSYIMTSAMPDAEARTTLGMTLQRKETGGSAEQGIYAAYRAIERSLASIGGNANFIRADSQLAVVVISDEDESANGAKNDPASFVKYVQDTFAGQKSVSFHSIIARPGDKACLNGEGYSAGFRYDAISKLTGGVIGDVCATDYAAQVQGIAEGVRKTLKSITLSCAPVVDSVRNVVVMKDGQVYDGTRVLQGLNVVFDQMLPAGDYQVNYTCLK